MIGVIYRNTPYLLDQPGPGVSAVHASDGTTNTSSSLPAVQVFWFCHQRLGLCLAISRLPLGRPACNWCCLSWICFTNHCYCHSNTLCYQVRTHSIACYSYFILTPHILHSAQRFPFLSKRTYYKFYGFYFLWLFVYKYLVDISFIFVSCTRLDDEIVSLTDLCKCWEANDV